MQALSAVLQPKTALNRTGAAPHPASGTESATETQGGQKAPVTECGRCFEEKPLMLSEASGGISSLDLGKGVGFREDFLKLPLSPEG